MKEIGKRLRNLREGIGVSQEKLAKMLGTTQSSINRYENGQTEPPVELFRKYADMFDVSMDYILPEQTHRKGSCISFSQQSRRTGKRCRNSLKCALCQVLLQTQS